MTAPPSLDLLSQAWRACGIRSGDTVLFHSNLRRLLLRARTMAPEVVLDSLLQAVGPDGTVLFPAFNFDFTRGEPFDIRTTPSKMGVITEAARRHPDAVRSGHPIYSFTAIGRRAEAFRVDNFSGYGPDSPFALLREMDGRIAVLDLPDERSMTFLHHVEEMHGVEYRHIKTFTGRYTDVNGDAAERTCGLFVRDIGRGVVTSARRMSELLWEQRLYQGDRTGEGTGLRSISANDLYDAVSRVIRAGEAQGTLYSIDPSLSAAAGRRGAAAPSARVAAPPQLVETGP